MAPSKSFKTPIKTPKIAPGGVTSRMNCEPEEGIPAASLFNCIENRFILAESDPNVTRTEESHEAVNSFMDGRTSGWWYRVLSPSMVLLSDHDRNKDLILGQDRLHVTGFKGYRMIKATHGVNRGSWYFEATITNIPSVPKNADPDKSPTARIGWAQQPARLDGPVGYDRFSYSCRSLYGTRFHDSRGKSCVVGGYTLGDVLGVMIVLPDDQNVPQLPPSFKDQHMVKVIGRNDVYFKLEEALEDKERCDIRKGSKIIFFKNGVPQGIAYEDIYCGTYYPAVSLYQGITVKVNLGPEFWAPPSQEEFQYQGMYERAEESKVLQEIANQKFIDEMNAKQALFRKHFMKESIPTENVAALCPPSSTRF